MDNWRNMMNKIKGILSVSITVLTLLLSVSVFASGKVFVFDPQQHSWSAYEDGKLVKSGVAAGGSGYCRDLKRPCRTPTGTYRVYFKGSPACVSTRFPLPDGGAPMPYCMFFH